MKIHLLFILLCFVTLSKPENQRNFTRSSFWFNYLVDLFKKRKLRNDENAKIY